MMEILIPRCAGMEVHQATVVVRVRERSDPGERRRVTETFGTMTRTCWRYGIGGRRTG
jgi:hypothetical protein